MQFYRRLQPIRAISFDLDDTLYDNIPVMRAAEAANYAKLCELFPVAAAWSQAEWAQRRWQLMQTDADLASDMTLLRLATIRLGLMQLGIDSKQAEAGAEQVLAAFLARRNQVDVPAQSHQLLSELGQHYPLIAISNGNVDTTKIGLRDYFTHVIQPGDGRRGKPYPDMFTVAQQAYPHLCPAQWLHVGDSPVADVLGAQRMGWQTAWFKSGLYDASSLIVLPHVAYHDNRQLGHLLLERQR
ncbi:HAD-IA family hydrolase [Pseudidiomarina sp. YC-516-91]|uniref:HAD-IA family hydrolase n=1 Tax=Pseudidiomarina salilacus TaxID=3384452 RepID=UPI003984F8D9